MKKYKITLTIAIILIAALIMFASFFGIYKKNENGEKISLIPGLKLGMEFGKTRVITANVNQQTTKTIYDSEGNIVTPEDGKEYTEEEGYKTIEQPINPMSIKTLENYKKVKDIFKKRLEGNNITEYTLELEEKTGDIKIEIPENSNSENIQSLLKNSGSLILLDGQTFETVLDSTYLTKADVMYNQGEMETAVFLQLTFNEEGTKKLKELNEIYVETTEEKTNEAGEKENTTTSKTVWVILNDKFLGTTVLPNIVYNDKIIFTFGVSSDNEKVQEAINEARSEATLLNAGTMPLAYQFSEEVKETNITAKTIFTYISAISVVFLIAFIYMIIKFRAKGFIAVYFQVGYLATLLLVLRLTNVVITMEGITAIVISMILDYVFTYITLMHIDRKTESFFKKANLEFFLDSLPIYVIAIVFTFAKTVNISSFGMSLFWGIIMIYTYNFIFSKFIFENISEK